MRASFLVSGVATGLRRNFSMSLALVLSTAISLTFFGSALLVGTEITRFESHYQSRINVRIYLCHELAVKESPLICKAPVTDQQKSDISNRLNTDPVVKSFLFMTAEQTTEDAKKVLPPDQVNYAGNLNGVFPATFTLKLHNVRKDYPAVVDTYSKIPGVWMVQNQSESLRAILDLFKSARWMAGVVAILVGIAAILQMANTIQVAAVQRRRETEIKRLVGASRLMTELPFTIEAVFAAAVGGIIAIFLDWGGRWYLLGHVFHRQIQAGTLPNLTGNDIVVAGGIGLLAGMAVAAVTAWATLRTVVRL